MHFKHACLSPHMQLDIWKAVLMNCHAAKQSSTGIADTFLLVRLLHSLGKCLPFGGNSEAHLVLMSGSCMHNDADTGHTLICGACISAGTPCRNA